MVIGEGIIRLIITVIRHITMDIPLLVSLMAEMNEAQQCRQQGHQAVYLQVVLAAELIIDEMARRQLQGQAATEVRNRV